MSTCVHSLVEYGEPFLGSEKSVGECCHLGSEVANPNPVVR